MCRCPDFELIMPCRRGLRWVRPNSGLAIAPLLLGFQTGQGVDEDYRHTLGVLGCLVRPGRGIAVSSLSVMMLHDSTHG